GLSGVFLEQCEEYNPDVLQSFQELNDTGNVELMGETYYHSLSFLYSKTEFAKQVKKHSDKIKKLFGKKPGIFRNTELIYNNELARKAKAMGFRGILAEGAKRILGEKSPNYVYMPAKVKMGLLLRNYKLSDDISFRFWMTRKKGIGRWMNKFGEGDCVNLFMDYETFGEHQWKETKIFDFMKKIPDLLKEKHNFMTPSELIKNYSPKEEINVLNIMSWADKDRGVSAWNGNRIQRAALRKLYRMEKEIIRSRNRRMMDEWRKMQTSDHYYYMCTKNFGDGDVHEYFNPYKNPYDSFIAFMNIIEDFKERLDNKKQSWSEQVMKNLQQNRIEV
ncbi:glycoside hydrolase family 57 protein, partial [Candidatus Woesearchaeota archaeon]|nr:glycoside hydrolase family 57 protein [Candidatus Woesearchaeota archaeon]